MQLVKASRDALLRPLQVVSGIVERRQTLPILANILLRKDGERVSFTATDLELQIQTSALIGTGKDVAATTVAARKLVDILRALPEADVQMSLASKKLAVASGKSRFNLQTLAAEEFPTVAQAEFTADFSLPAATLKYLLSMVHFAMAQQDI
ncbi:MAG TPA: DNA polymerase III subunit beta, partial [Burkholderiaceae bacterium]|nr:DNA polymerase III subunit beta [Burkholderiaceae bacterium]